MISSADGAAYVYRNGVEIGRAPIGGLRGVHGAHVYSALANVDAKGRRDWLSVTSVGGRAPNLKDLAKQVSVDQQFLAQARALITPGTTLILTDAPVSVSTRSGSGFNILTTAETPWRAPMTIEAWLLFIFSSALAWVEVVGFLSVERRMK